MLKPRARLHCIALAACSACGASVPDNADTPVRAPDGQGALVGAAGAGNTGADTANPSASSDEAPRSGPVETGTGSTGDAPRSEELGTSSMPVPGRLLVNRVDLDDLQWVSYLYAGQTGDGTQLPRAPSDGSEVSWSVSADGTQLLRYDSRLGELARFDANTSQLRTTLSLFNLSEPALSFDGRYVLAQWYDDEAGETLSDRNLAVFDASTGELVEYGSEQPNGYGYGRSYAWLRDGRYIYFVDREVYVTTPGEPGANVLLTLDALPEPVATSLSTGQLAVSPDGTKLAFSWGEERNDDVDTNLWVVNLDGSGLHRLTQAPSPLEPLRFTHNSPAWSPDSTRVLGVRYMSGVVTAPVGNGDFDGSQVVGATGCIDQVFIVAADAEDVALTWPGIDTEHGVTVRNAASGPSGWLTTCTGTASWIE